MENGKDKQTWLVGTPDALKGACPVWGALDGNLLPKDNKAPSFDSIPQQWAGSLAEPAWQPSVEAGRPRHTAPATLR